MFLLEKRENAMLKLNNTQELGYIFEPAYSAIKSNNKGIYFILGLGMVGGLICSLLISLFLGFHKGK